MVKPTVIFIAVLLANSLLASESCSKSNSFLKKMVEEGKISANKRPIESNHCGTEWRTFGTCCTLESAKKYAATDLVLLKNGTTLVVESMESQVKLMKEMATTIRLWMDADKKLSKSSKGRTALDNQETKLSELNYVQTSLHEKCWIHEMGKLRSASLCSTCSSRSNLFFEQGKALVSIDTCTEMLNYCFPSIDHIVKTMDITYSFYTMIVDFQKKGKLDIDLDDTIKDAKKNFKEIERSEMEPLRKYSVSAEGSPQRHQMTKTLCQYFLQLHGDPFIIKIMKLMLDITQALTSLNTATNAVKQKVESSQLNLKDKVKSIKDSNLSSSSEKKEIEKAAKQFHEAEKSIKKQNEKANKQVDEELKNQENKVKSLVNNYKNTFQKPDKNDKKSRKLLFTPPPPESRGLFGLSAEILVIDNDNKWQVDLAKKNREDSASKQISKSSYFGTPMNLTLAFP